MIFGDDARLGQLFHNLLENSLRYTDSGGQIVVRGQQDETQIRIDWSDSAPGLTEEQFSQILSVSTAANPPATGPAADPDSALRFVIKSRKRITGR